MSFFPDVEPPAPPPRVKSTVPPWFGPSMRELGIPFPTVGVIGRRAGVALCLSRIEVFREGWAFALAMRAARPADMADDEWFDVLDVVQFGGRIRRNRGLIGLRVGVELADGTKVIADERGRPMGARDSEQAEATADAPRLALHRSGGGGGDDEYEHTLNAWLYPAPSSGPIRLVCDWPELGIQEGSISIDSGPLIEARSNVIDIWAE